MNGAVIGMAVIHRHHKPILPDHQQTLSVCFVVVVGSTALGIALCLFATATFPTFATTTLGSGWLPIRLWAFASILKLKKGYSHNKQGK